MNACVARIDKCVTEGAWRIQIRKGEGKNITVRMRAC